MAISRQDLALWVEAEFEEYLTAAGLTVGDGTHEGNFVGAITKALREMGYSTAASLVDSDAAEIYDLVELYALERIVDALGIRVDFTADGSTVHLRQQHDAAVARLERQRAKCAASWGVGGTTPKVVARTVTLGALTEEVLEYSTWY